LPTCSLVRHLAWDGPALLFENQVYTYAELEALSNQVAHVLIGQGLKPGDVVCQVLRSRPELIINLFGILKSGAIYAPLNPSLTERELAAQFIDCQPSIIIADEELAQGTVASAVAGLPGCQVWSVGELITQARKMSALRPDRSIDLQGPALLFYTSGTTGRSKGVQLSHGNVLTNARQVLSRTGLESRDRLLVIMPIFHANALCNQIVVPFLAGAAIALKSRFVLEEFWPCVARYRPTYFTAVPTILSRLLEGSAPAPKLDVSSLRFVRTGAAPLALELQRRFEARFGLPVIVSYGLTEATCTVTMNRPTQEARRLGSVGTALDGIEVRVIGSDGEEESFGSVGEVVVRGPTVMLGYRGLPESTKDAIPDGWLRTGDLGYLDHDGHLFLTDRKKDIIIRGAENISAREIEDVLHAHPLVQEAAVVGAPDSEFGEVVVAFVVLRKIDQFRSEADEALLAHCRDRLARYKVPARIEVLKEIPKNAVGKVAKQELRGRAAASFRSGS
jgi:acyl-CoA synthetase (AMP-forming)/AMP-acid ligase II